ncbi:MAG: hypothetical protein AB8H47_28290 [Bacteroidia bacterium]
MDLFCGVIYRRSILTGLSLVLTTLLLIVEYDLLIPLGQKDELALEWEWEENLEEGSTEVFENDFSGANPDGFSPIGERLRFCPVPQIGGVCNQNCQFDRSEKVSLSILYCSLKLDFC